MSESRVDGPRYPTVNEPVRQVERLCEYPFPLRPAMRVWLRLPDDLTTDEADQLAAFVRTLARETE